MPLNKTTFFERVLRPGDVLLYRPASFWGQLIALKTWSSISHVEVYVGNGQSVASRDGKGVALYPLRPSELTVVLRPVQDFPGANFVKAMDWFKTVAGQKYDWFGLLVFEKIRQHGSRDKQWCSNFAARFMRVLLDPVALFGESLDADQVAPSTFLASPALKVYWHE